MTNKDVHTESVVEIFWMKSQKKSQDIGMFDEYMGLLIISQAVSKSSSIYWFTMCQVDMQAFSYLYFFRRVLKNIIFVKQ